MSPTIKKGIIFDPLKFLASAGAGKTIVSYLRDEVIFAQADRADAVYYVLNGKLKLSVVSKNGREGVIALLDHGDFFGEGCLAGQKVRMATARTMSDCQVVRLNRDEIIRLLKGQPAFSEVFVKHLLSRNIRIEEDLVDQLFNSSEKRLARALLLLANFGKEGVPETVLPRISQETLAEIVGTTRSRISFFMNKFRRLGFIEYNGKLTVHSSLLNVVLHD